MLDDELIVEEHISYVYIEKEHCKVTTGQSNVISAELSKAYSGAVNRLKSP
jgi:hypothetical protein